MHCGVLRSANGNTSSPRRGPHLRVRAARTVPAFVILLVLAWQSVFVQTHVHPLASLPDAPLISSVATRAHATSASEIRRDVGACVLCQALTLAGSLVPPTPPAAFLPGATTAIASPSRLTLWLRRDRSHAWLGRGPPHRSPTRHT